MADLTHVSVVAASRPAAGHVLLALDPAPLAPAHERAGQYLMFQGPGDEKPRPLALASAPGRSPLELLIRAEGERAEALLALSAGDRVQASAPAGPGFPVGDAAGRPLWLYASGSALGPIRAALQAALELPDPPRAIRLVYGVRHEDQTCFPDELAAWAARGVEVVVCVSQPRGPDARRGRVSQHLGDLTDAAEALVFVCGQPAMMDEVTQRLTEAGVSPGRVKRNF